MKTSQKLQNLTAQLSTLPEALDYAIDEIEALETLVLELESRLLLAQSEALSAIQSRDAVPAPVRTPKTDLETLARSYSEAWQVSEGIVWGLFLDEIVNTKFYNPVRELPEPTIFQDFKNTFMTDLHQFIEMYKKFGIELNPIEDEDSITIKLGENIDSGKIEGYCGFFSTVVFTKQGKFIKQGFWE